jgi:hypothetical protein
MHFSGTGQPHQQHHAHPHRADRDLPAPEPDCTGILRHEFRDLAASSTSKNGLWWTLGTMDGDCHRRWWLLFWRKRYLARTGR